MSKASLRPLTQRTRRVAGLATLALTLPLALAACGSDDESAALADCDSTTKVSIMMGTSDMDISYAPYASLAKSLGYFEAECLDVTVTTSGGQTTTAQAVIGGAADIAMQTPDTLITAAETERMPIQVFHNLVPRVSYEIAVKKGSDITSDADLADKIVGFPMLSDGMSGYLATRMADADSDAKTVEQVGTGFGATSAEALQSEKIDAFVGWPGMWAAFTSAGYDFDLLPAPEWQNDYYGIGLGATDEYIEKNPEVIEGVSRAVSKSMVFLKENPEAAVDLFWEAYPERAPLGANEDEARKDTLMLLESAAETMRLDDFDNDHTWGVQTAEAWEKQVEFNRSIGLVSKKFDVTEFFTNEFNEAANDFDRDAIVEQADKA